MELIDDLASKRASVGRRNFSWRTVVFGFLRSRRHRTRRHDEGEVLFLDWHHPWLFVMAVGTMLLSCVDAFMTLQLLNHGMVETNPVMAAILEYGTGPFAATKMAMTGIGILALVFLAKGRFLNRMRTGVFLTVLFSFYLCLVCYEFVYLLRYL